MSEAQNNPYLDPTLMDAYMNYSPSENNKYLKEHGASKATQQIAATSTTAINNNQQTVITQPLYQPDANSQEYPDDMIENNVISLPFATSDPDQLPLGYDDLSTLKKGDIIWMLDIDEEDEETEAWTRGTFIEFDGQGFTYKDNTGEEIFAEAYDDDQMPCIFKNEKPSSPVRGRSYTSNNDENKENDAKNINYIIKDFEYKQGAKLFVYDEEDNFTPFTLESYDVESGNASLKDNSGVIKQLCLKQYKHESAESTQSKKLEITESKNNDDESKENTYQSKGRLGQFIPINKIQGIWSWIQRTNSMKLKWISYKNTLLGTIAGASKHLYPISLDYKTLMFISGCGLGFSWLDLDYGDIEEDEDIEWRKKVTRDDIIDDHMKLFLIDSQLDSTLQKIGKYSHYKFERHAISEILYDEQNAVGRLLNLEARVIKGITQNVCSITNDENGHLALIVGYIKKPAPLQKSNVPTLYYFKVKKFGTYMNANKEDNEKEEYIAVDLYNQSFVITMDPPEKKKDYAFAQNWNPSMLLKILTDLIATYEQQQQVEDAMVSDLFGRKALNLLSELMKEAKQKENVSNKLAKQTVFALIRLFDARKTSIDFFENNIIQRISNAYHSQTGAEKEWKLKKEVDISDEAKVIVNALKEETAAIRRQKKLFEEYVLPFDGQPLGTIQWETYDRAGLKSAIDEIVHNEDLIIDMLKKMKAKLVKQCASS